ncbi:hypothetical protein BDR26DRAFT_860305 [Obelidium mucronatum]|nr:hypothetical protein BDR26DRAFT_860305 [Obelidium mucronatum]
MQAPLGGGTMSHAQKAEEWVDRHLQARGRTRAGAGRRGLYLHGINKNSCQLETWSTDRVKQVGSDFGFLNVESEIKDSFEGVLSGSYKGRPVEGFVIRCTSKETGQCLMFKIKFDEPYLMFREWREITNMLIPWSPSHSAIPSFRNLYFLFLKHKGIIAVRNLFLHERNIQEFSHLLKEASFTLTRDKDQGSNSSNNNNDHDVSALPLVEFPTRILILPIAIVGQGKTTLGSALMSQYHQEIAHIQSDSHQKKPAFLKAVMAALSNKNVVYVDRNNHLDIHRTEVSKMFKSKYPGGRILALEWDVKGVLEIELRGEHHLKLTPQKTPGYVSITQGFFRDFTPVDHREGSLDVQAIDALVKIPLDSTLSERVRLVADAMGWTVDEIKLAERQAKVDATQK